LGRENLQPFAVSETTAAPSTGTIEQAEKIVEKLGVAKSFDRRFATLLNDVQVKLRMPTIEPAEPVKAGGVFDHLRADKAKVAEVVLPPVNFTWDKFRRTVLPNALSLAVMVPYSGGFYGLVTATDPEAPAIIHGMEWAASVIPVSWYFYHGGSTAARWNLAGNQWADVTAVFESPYAGTMRTSSSIKANGSTSPCGMLG